jgi:hypothetical protein
MILIAVADPEDRNAAFVCVADQPLLRQAPESATCGQYTLHSLPNVSTRSFPSNGCQSADVLAVTFREGVPAFAKPIGHEPAVGIDDVGDQQGAHTHNGTRGTQVAMKTFFNSV